MCKNQYEHNGSATYGSNIPFYAQGTQFRGDESGTYCKISESMCRNQDGDTPEDCYASTVTDWACPVCLEHAEDNKLTYNPVTEAYYCKWCGSEIKKDDLPQEYINLFQQMAEDERVEYEKLKAVEDGYTSMCNKCNRLQAKLVEIAGW